MSQSTGLPASGSAQGRSLQRDSPGFRLLIGVSCLLLLVQWFWTSSRRPQPLVVQRGSQSQSGFLIDVNQAGWVEWMQLEGVGPALASRIVADRQVHGPFATIEDLGRVPGIGPATIDRIRSSLRIRHEHQTADRRLP
jgi:competence ComEA-like helix-hairpin-helix protein